MLFSRTRALLKSAPVVTLRGGLQFLKIRKASQEVFGSEVLKTKDTEGSLRDIARSGAELLPVPMIPCLLFETYPTSEDTVSIIIRLRSVDCITISNVKTKSNL